MAYHSAPDEVIRTLLLLIDRDNEQHQGLLCLEAVADCWDARLAQAVALKLEDPKMTPVSTGAILSSIAALTKPDLLPFAARAIEFARALVAAVLLLEKGSDESTNSRAVAAAHVLLLHSDNAGWSVVWPAVCGNLTFGRQLMEQIAPQDHRSERLLQHLTEDQLAGLYVWLEAQYPRNEDPKHKGAFTVGPREAIADWRDRVLLHLQGRGTQAACDAISRLMHELPHHKGLWYILLQSQNLMRRMTWCPPTPNAILKLVSSDQVRVVQSGQQLLDLVVESLRRLQQKLHGETPAAPFLWGDKASNGSYRPKDENTLSDFVKIHLVEDLKGHNIIANREVQIRRGYGTMPGENADIHVEAVVPGHQADDSDVITVIIETKGCWHSELTTAMRTQLVERYLENNRCQHGLYLVGWYNCSQWDIKDYRQKRAAKLDMDHITKELQEQANHLSNTGRRIQAFVLNTALGKS